MRYRNYKNFDEYLFLSDLKRKAFLTNSNGANKIYQCLTETFLTIVKKTFLKKKIVRDNQAPLINRESRKATCTRSRLCNKHWKHLQKMNAFTNKETTLFLLWKKG